MTSPYYAVRLLTMGTVLCAFSWQIVPMQSALASDPGSVVRAEASFNMARQRYEAAMQRLVSLRQSAIQAKMSSPEYRSIVAGIARAHSDYLSLSEKATAELATTNPKYQELLRQQEAVAVELSKARASADTSLDDFTRLAEKKLAINSQLQAVANDAMRQAGVPEFKKRWEQASRDLERIQASLKSSVEQEPEIIEARKAVSVTQDALDHEAVQLNAVYANYDARMQKEAQAQYERTQRDMVNWYVIKRQYGGGWSGPFGGE